MKWCKWSYYFSIQRREEKECGEKAKWVRDLTSASLEVEYQFGFSLLVWLWEILLISLSKKSHSLYTEVSRHVYTYDYVCEAVRMSASEERGEIATLIVYWMEAYYSKQEMLKYRRFLEPRIKYFCGRVLQWVRESRKKNKGEKLGRAEFKLEENLKRGFR